MRSHKKQLVKQRLFQNISAEPNPSVPTIQWKTTPKIPMAPSNSHLQSAPTPPLQNFPSIPSCSHSSFKQVINGLLIENSELRKTIYRLDHQKSILILKMENKELEYKNVIFEYRQMIQDLLERIGYNGIEQYEKSLDQGKKSEENWEERRSHLYQKYEELRGLHRGLNFHGSSRRSSASLQCKSRSNQSISINISRQKGNQQIEDPQEASDGKHFVLKQCDFLNFNFDIQREVQTQQLQSMSSLTQVIQPHNPQNFVQIEQIPTLNLQMKEGKVATANTSKAQTQRVEKVSNHERKDRKSSGRVSSQGTYSNQSFKRIVEKGMKNRERIQKLLQNCVKLDHFK